MTKHENKIGVAEQLLSFDLRHCFAIRRFEDGVALGGSFPKLIGPPSRAAQTMPVRLGPMDPAKRSSSHKCFLCVDLRLGELPRLRSG
jgi:hypothetical protein